MANTNATEFRNILVDMPDFPGAEVEFWLLTRFAANGTEAFPKKKYVLTLDASGLGTQALPVPPSDAWLWRVVTPDGKPPYNPTLAAGADLQLTTWLASAQSTETAASLVDQFAGLANFDAHVADTTAVHGIADTSALETVSGAQAKADAAEAAAIAASEPDLGNPGTDGHVLSSTIAGARSWIAGGGGSGDLLADGSVPMTGPLVSSPTAEPAVWLKYDPNYAETKNWYFRFGTPTTNAGDATRKDHPLKWGYNVGADGGRDDTADHAFYLQMEDYYAPDANTRVAEYHLNFTSADGLTSFRPFHINVHLGTDVSNPLTATHEYKGRQIVFVSHAGHTAMQILPGANAANSSVIYQAQNVVRLDSANAFGVLNAANTRRYFNIDTVNERVDVTLFNDSGFRLNNSGGSQLLAFSSDGKMTIGAGGKFAHLYVFNTTDDEALILRPFASQTKPLIELWNKSAVPSWRVDWEGIVDYRGTMGDSTKTVGTDAPIDWIEVKINGTTRYIPAYAA